MKRWLFAFSVLLASPASWANVTAPAAEESAPANLDLTTLPLGKGLPVVVRVGLYYVDVAAVDENEGTFTATVDLRLRWQDLRLRYPADEAVGGIKQLRGEVVEKKLSEIWVPDVRMANLVDEPSNQIRSLRMDPSGRVELMQRTTAQFTNGFDVGRFPFDRQKLEVELVSQRDNLEQVTLDFRQDDLDFSRAAPGIELEDWQPGLVDIRRDPMAGWYAQTHARLRVGLEMKRRIGGSIAPIFIPLLASLLIPLMAIWMNKVEDGDFQVEAFELANVIIGGLFAVIALNFTVNSEYSTIASGDNTVTRLFGLNYLTLAISLAINIALFRFNLAKRAWGGYVQEQLYLYLVWAVPLLVLATATALLLVAMA